MDLNDSEDDSSVSTNPVPEAAGGSVRGVTRSSNNNSVAALSSPARKRARVIVSHLSSSSLKKRKFKLSHCRYCCRVRGRTDLEKHLKESDVCLNLYLRELRVRSLDAVLMKLFPCLGCDKTGKFYITQHLRQSQQCLQVYQERFHVQDIGSLTKKLRNLSRQSQSSRQNLSRKLENQKAQSKVSSTKTISEAINDYKRNTALSNWRYCCRCGGNFLESGVSELDQTSSEFDSMKLAEKPELRRMNKYFLCLVCSQSNIGVVDSQIVTKPILKITRRENDGTQIMVPDFDSNIDLPEEALEESIRKIYIPSNIKCIDLTDVSNIKKEPGILQKVYRCNDVNVSLLSAMYVTQYSKFKSRMLHAERFVGTVAEMQERKLSHVKPIVDDSDIRGSDSWEVKKMNGLSSRFRQFGDCCIAVEILIDFDNIETVATSFLVQGLCVSVSFLGDQNYDLQTKYSLHDHNSGSDCNPNCHPADLEELLQQPDVRNKRLSQQFNPVFIASVYQKLHFFVELLVKSPSFDLHSEEYSFDVEFGDNDAKISGFLWPKACADFSRLKSESTLTGTSLEEGKADLLSFLTKTLLTTVDHMVLKQKMKMTEEEVTDLVDLIKKVQLDFNTKNPVLPSLETSFKFLPHGDSSLNIRGSKTLLNLIKEDLVNLSQDEKKSLSVIDWLEVVLSNTEFELTNERVSIKIKSELINFKLDERLKSLMDKFGETLGLYQYCVTCATDRWNENKVVMQKSDIIESFVHSYNPTLLRALRTRVKANQLCGIIDVENISRNEDEHLEEAQVSLLESHSLVSTLQLFSFMDSNKIKEMNSSPIEFVNCKSDQPVHFRRIHEKNDNCFELEGEGKFFELLGSNIIRHKLRMNCRDLILAELAIMYDYIGKSQSAELYDVYKNNLSKIPKSTTASILDDQIVLPTLILCENQQVMKLRKNPKVLSFPNFCEESDDFKLCKVMLFYPTMPGAVIAKEDVSNYYYSTPRDGPVDARGDRLTLIEINERFVLNKS